MMIPAYTHFQLNAPLDHAPAGATGQLKRLDSFHVALIFDNYPDLVFDINDTEPDVWAAISPTVNPSMTDPPEKVIALSLASLLVTTPIAMAFVHLTAGRGAITTFALGIAWAAVCYGWRGAVPLVFATLLVDHFCITLSDGVALLPASPIEWYTLGSFLFLAFLGEIGRNYLHPE